ncbi:radical SAM protein [Gemmatimonadota bacterium]
METGEEQTVGTAKSEARYVFGPVFSRRLGQSLGIDPVPAKTCNWNCVYCQLGRTMPLRSERAEYSNSEDILREAEAALSRSAVGTIDWVTLVGSGETLLHSRVGWMIQRLKKITDLPLAVITNGSLLSDPGVRKELLLADAVLPSLDAGTPGLFKRINRPHPGITFHQHVKGLEAFGREYRGKLLIEVMLIKGVNDTEKALSDLAAVMDQINPDGIHLSRPDRPPAEPWVCPTDEEGFTRALSALGSVAQILHPAESVLRLEGPAHALETLLAVLGRHPLSDAQLQRALAHWPPEDASAFLASLEGSSRIKKTLRHGESFWVSSEAAFPSSPSDHS